MEQANLKRPKLTRCEKALGKLKLKAIFKIKDQKICHYKKYKIKWRRYIVQL